MAELPPDSTTAVLEPLPLPPARHALRPALPSDALPPPLLVVDVRELTHVAALLGDEGSEVGPLCPPELCVSVAVTASGTQGRGPPTDGRAAAGAGSAPERLADAGDAGRLSLRTRAVPAVPAAEPPGDEGEVPALGVRAGGRDGAGAGGGEAGREHEGLGPSFNPNPDPDPDAGPVARATPGAVRWRERLLLELPHGVDWVGVEVAVWDAAAAGGVGAALARTVVRLDLKGWAPMEARDATIQLPAQGAARVRSLLLQSCVSGFRV